MVETIHGPAHPKNIADDVTAAMSIEMKMDTALHAQTAAAKQSGLDEVTDYLKAMTPAERMAVGSVLDNIARNLGDTSKRESGRKSVPLAECHYDANHDLSSVSFKDVSDDKQFGSSLQISLSGTTDSTSHRK